MVVWWTWFSLAEAVTVCSGTDPYYQQDCDLSTCDYCTLTDALYDGATEVLLLPGMHFNPSYVWQPNTTIEGPGALLYAFWDETPMISIGPDAVGSRLVDLTLISNGSGWDGPLVEVLADGVVLARLASDGLRARSSLGGGTIRVIDAHDVRIEEPSFIDNMNAGTGSGGAISIRRSSVDIVGGEISRSSGWFGAIYAANSDVTITDTILSGNAANDTSGSQVFAVTSNLWLDNVALTASGDSYGAVVYHSDGGTLSLVGGSVSAGASGYIPYGVSGLVTAVNVDRVTVSGLRFDEHERTAIAMVQVGALSLTDVVFTGSRGGVSGGAVIAAAVESVDVSDSWFCNEVSDSGAALRFLGSCEDGCSIQRSMFAGGLATETGGAIRLDAGTLDIDQSTLVGNEALEDGGAIDVRGGVLNLRHSLVVGSRRAGAAVAGKLGEFAYNAFGDNLESDTSVVFPDASPNLRDVAPVFVASESPCGGALALGDDPANRWLIENRVGVYTPCWGDVDGDGFGADFVVDGPLVCTDGYAAEAGDCDDGTATVFPGATDSWYDGVDADCAGNDDQDQDGDGVSMEVDCDDLDPVTGRCAIAVGGGCATGPSPGLPGLWVAALLLLRRRG